MPHSETQILLACQHWQEHMHIFNRNIRAKNEREREERKEVCELQRSKMPEINLVFLMVKSYFKKMHVPERVQGFERAMTWRKQRRRETARSCSPIHKAFQHSKARFLRCAIHDRNLSWMESSHMISTLV